MERLIDNIAVFTKITYKKAQQDVGFDPEYLQEYQDQKFDDIEQQRREKIRQDLIQREKNKNPEFEGDFPGVLQDPAYEGEFAKYKEEPGPIDLISDQDRHALQDLQKYFEIRHLAGETLYTDFKGGREIKKREIPLNPKIKTTKLLHGDLQVVLTTSQISGDEPQITDVFLDGMLNVSPNSEQPKLEDLSNYSFVDGVKLIIDTMPLYKAIEKEEKKRKLTPGLDAKREILPNFVPIKSGPNTLVGGLVFPKREFPVNHPNMGDLISSFDMKPVGIRITKGLPEFSPIETSTTPSKREEAEKEFEKKWEQANKPRRASFSDLLNSVKLAQQSGFKSVRKQRQTEYDIAREFYEAGRKHKEISTLPEKAEKVRPDEKFSVYIQTQITPKGESTGDEIFVGSIYGQNPKDALDMLIRVSGQTKSGYTPILEKIYRIALGLEKPPAQPKDLKERYIERSEKNPSKRKEDRLERGPEKGVREVSKEEIESWKRQ